MKVIDYELFGEELKFSRSNIYLRIPNSPFLIPGKLKISARQSLAFISWFPEEEEKIIEVTNISHPIRLTPSSPNLIFHTHKSFLNNDKFMQNNIYFIAKNGIYIIIEEETSFFESHLMNEKYLEDSFISNVTMNIASDRITINYHGTFTFIDFIDFSNNNFTNEFMRSIKSLTLVDRTCINPYRYCCKKASSIGEKGKSTIDYIFSSNAYDILNSFIHGDKAINEFSFFRFESSLRSSMEEFLLIDYEGKSIVNKRNVQSKENKTDSNLFEINKDKWAEYFDDDGKVISLDQIKEDVCKYGTSEEIRLEAYKFILGYYPLNLTYQERTKYDSEKSLEFDELYNKWKNLCDKDKENIPKYSYYEDIIKKDVSRCDITHSFFSGEDNSNRIIVHDILMTHLIYNPSLGYVQGMNEFVIPLLYCFKNMRETFWCFAYLMKLKVSYFDNDQGYLMKIATILPYLLKFLNPKFFLHLIKADMGDLLFTIGWLKIDFKRCFDYTDILRIWEVSWTTPHREYYYAFFTLSVILNRYQHIIQDNLNTTNDIYEFYRDPSNFDYQELLKITDTLITQIKGLRFMPDFLSKLLN